MWERRPTDIPAMSGLEPHNSLQSIRSTSLVSIDNDLVCLVTDHAPPQKMVEASTSLTQQVVPYSIAYIPILGTYPSFNFANI